jgi:hypothetical protein
MPDKELLEAHLNGLVVHLRSSSAISVPGRPSVTQKGTTVVRERHVPFAFEATRHCPSNFRTMKIEQKPSRTICSWIFSKPSWTR